MDIMTFKEYEDLSKIASQNKYKKNILKIQPNVKLLFNQC